MLNHRKELEEQWGLTKTAIAKIPPAQGPIDPAVDHAIKEFVEFANKTVQTVYGNRDPRLPEVKLVIQWGPRFARIVRDEGNSKSSFGFVDRTNGDILKAASWSAPAAGPRGNVLDRSTWAASHGPYGMAYRRASVKTAFNKFNAPDVLGALFAALEAAFGLG